LDDAVEAEKEKPETVGARGAEAFGLELELLPAHLPQVPRLRP
jgi:hypothetical protein